MDATRMRCWAAALALTLIVGCFDTTPPSARQEEVKPPRQREYEPPQVVETEPGTEAETADDEETPQEVSGGVIEWIQQVDDARIRAERRSWRADDSQGARQVADATIVPTPPGLTLIKDADRPDPETKPAPQPTSAPAAVAPPRLNAVNVRSTATVRTAQQDPVAPGVNSSAVARGAPLSLREFLEQVPPPDDGSFRAQLDLRLLWIIAGEYDRARAPLELVSAEQQEVAAPLHRRLHRLA